ncbi:MAG: endonuclease/exonuclease/phosphatase family protein [Acidimicrobiales bacterium]|nr:endonuclease/exonuclease/phosphatase family protein [Acidimicrobiales bacterium]
MRILCWNLRGGTDAKWDLLRSLRPDVAVLPEAARAPRRAEATLLDPAAHWHWVGANPAKGLAVTTFGRSSGVLAPEATGRWSIAARQGALTVLGVWSCPSDGHYAREVQRAVDSHARWFDPDADVIVAGDFNVDAAGALRRRSGTFRRLADHLHALGLTSAYHLVRSEPYGAESRATYYHHRNAAHPFHIDFCFVSKPLVERVRSVEVGTFEEWVAPGHSDHVPIVVELD